jgi:Uma2 family endonuclease
MIAASAALTGYSALFLMICGGMNLARGRCRMTGMRAVHRVSFAELERWPEDGRRYELYDGEVYEVPSPILLHQIVAGRLYVRLNDYVREHGGIVLFAPLDIVLTDYDVVQPDLLLFTKEREGLLNLRKANRAAPDLAIEILSPATAANDRGRKMQLLARHRVSEYWLVDPERVTIEVHSLRGQQFALTGAASGRERVHSLLLPGLALVPSDLVPA